MNVLIDTNIVLDDILNRGSNALLARKISAMSADGLINSHITASSVTDIFYIVSKSLDKGTAKKIIRNLLISYSVVSVGGQDCLHALNLPMDDFEDALMAACASKANLDYIVTSDKLFINEAALSVPAISPTNFLIEFEGMQK